MLKDEILDFLNKIDQHLVKHVDTRSGKFEFKIIGKSALLLAGLIDSIGTVDIDSLTIEGAVVSEKDAEVIKVLQNEFGRANITVHGHYIEFVSSSIVFLPRKAEWVGLGVSSKNITVQYLEPHCNIASKLFSAFATPPRKKDKQDIVSALDQKLVDFQKILNIADKIFDEYSMDARNTRFKNVSHYIRNDLMAKFGDAILKYEHDEEIS